MVLAPFGRNSQLLQLGPETLERKATKLEIGWVLGTLFGTGCDGSVTMARSQATVPSQVLAASTLGRVRNLYTKIGQLSDLGQRSGVRGA
jgi:hypothetical protein